MVPVGLVRPYQLSRTVVRGWLTAATLVLLLPAAALALTSIVQAYKIAASAPIGSIVSLAAGSSDTVVPANVTNVTNLFGVTVDSNSALLSLSNGTGNQVQVATNGVTSVLVSDINGPINNGDEITASPIGGVGMKATGNVKVIGVAQENLGDSPGKSQQTYTDSNKQKHTVVLGEIPVQVNVAYYYKQPDKTLIPSVIQNLADAVAGKQASPVPIIVSMVIFIVAAITIFGLVYAAIRSSIISVGRNPMSQGAVYRSLIQVTMLVLFIAGIAITAIFLILARS